MESIGCIQYMKLFIQIDIVGYTLSYTIGLVKFDTFKNYYHVPQTYKMLIIRILYPN